jgi:hypothetical protein
VHDDEEYAKVLERVLKESAQQAESENVYFHEKAKKKENPLNQEK